MLVLSAKHDWDLAAADLIVRERRAGDGSHRRQAAL